MPCLGETLAPGAAEKLENPESPLWARKWGLPRLCPWQPPEVRASFQELLRRELAEPSLRRPSGAACRELAPSPCQRVLDGCLPHAASLVHLLSGVSSEELLPEAVAALAREEERLTPFASRPWPTSRAPRPSPTSSVSCRRRGRSAVSSRWMALPSSTGCRPRPRNRCSGCSSVGGSHRSGPWPLSCSG